MRQWPKASLCALAWAHLFPQLHSLLLPKGQNAHRPTNISVLERQPEAKRFVIEQGSAPLLRINTVVSAALLPDHRHLRLSRDSSLIRRWWQTRQIHNTLPNPSHCYQIRGLLLSTLICQDSLYTCKKFWKEKCGKEIMPTVWVWLASFHWDTLYLEHLSWINHTKLMERNNDKLSVWCSHPVCSNTANWFLLQIKWVLTDYEYSSSLAFILLLLWKSKEQNRMV